MESQRNWQKHDQREDFLRKEVGPVIRLIKGGVQSIFSPKRYNDDISLEDAIHTALLTLKEGFEGQMTEKTIEIGVVTVPTAEAQVVPTGGRPLPTFRKLSEEEVKDYLAL